MIEEADDDCDGGLTFDEFSNVMMQMVRGESEEMVKVRNEIAQRRGGGGKNE